MITIRQMSYGAEKIVSKIKKATLILCEIKNRECEILSVNSVITIKEISASYSLAYYTVFLITEMYKNEIL